MELLQLWVGAGAVVRACVCTCLEPLQALLCVLERERECVPGAVAAIVATDVASDIAGCGAAQ